MKIITSVHSTASTGGTEMSAFQGTRELARRGHEMQLIYGQGGDLLDDYRTFCRRVSRVEFIDYWYPLSRKQMLIDHLRLVPTIATAARHAADVYYVNRIFSAAWAVPAGRLRGVPVVSHERGFFHPGRDRIAWLTSHVTRFIANSQFTADRWVEAGIDADKLAVVYNGVDPGAYPRATAESRAAARDALGLGDDMFVAVFVGRLHPEKGVQVLLDAWAQLDLPPESAQLLVVGADEHGASSPDLTALSTHGRPGSVRFLGLRRDVVTPLHAADISVVPSVFDEPFGRVVIEALSTGCPVLASRVGGIPEILNGSMDRFLFERGNVDELARLIASAAEWRRHEPELAEQCVRVASRFSLTSMVDGIEGVLRSATR